MCIDTDINKKLMYIDTDINKKTDVYRHRN